jgi:hypothetical protein
MKKVASYAKRFTAQWIEKHLAAYPGDDASSDEDSDSDEAANVQSNVDVKDKGKAKAVPSPTKTAAQASSQAPTSGLPRNTAPIYINGFNPAPQATASSWSNPGPASISTPTPMLDSKKQKGDATMVNNDLVAAATASTPSKTSAPAQTQGAPTSQIPINPQNASSSSNIPHSTEVVMSDEEAELVASDMSDEESNDDDSTHFTMRGIACNIKTQRSKPSPKQKPATSGRCAKKSGVRRTSIAAKLDATPSEQPPLSKNDTAANQLPRKSSLREFLRQFVVTKTYQPTPLQHKRQYEDGEHQPCGTKKPCVRFDPEIVINHVANEDAELLRAMEGLSISESAPQASNMQRMVEICESTGDVAQQLHVLGELFRPSRFRPLLPTYSTHFGYVVHIVPTPLVAFASSSLPTSASSTPRSSSTSFQSTSTAKTSPSPACQDEEEEL